MIHPENRLKGIWDFVVLFFTVAAALFIPPAIVFGTTNKSLIILINAFVTAVFAFDIFVTFNASFQLRGKLVTDRKSISDQYLRTWFALDLFAALPIWLILQAAAPAAANPIHLLGLNVLVKLFRVGKTLKRIGGNNINPAILRLFLLVFWIIVVAHFIACGWIYIVPNDRSLPNADRYVVAFYWTITTLTTIGYGDITPSTTPQIIYVIIIELLGAGMYGLVIGNIANLIANIDVAKTQYKEKLDKINAFMKYRNIPSSLQKKINSYYNYLWESRRGYDESSVLEDLPDPLKISVSLYLNKEIIEKVPIFEKASDDLIRDIIMNLDPVVFTPGDYIVKAGELGYDMFFISKGSVDVVSADEKTVYATLTSGQFFGEIALLLSMPRTATIIAKEYCDLYRLEKDTFDRVLTRHPEFAETIQELADSRRAEQSKVTVESGESRPAESDSAPEEVTDPNAKHNGYEITLEWRAVEGASHYEVVRKDPKSGKWNYLSNNVTVPIFTDRLIMPQKPNVYRIRAVNVSGPGPWSEPIVVKKSRR